MIRFYVKKYFLTFFIISLIVAFIVGNRGATRDTEVCYSVFKNIKNLNLLNAFKFYIVTGMEIGFGWYSFVVSLFTNSNFILFFSFSFLNFYIVYKISEKITTKYVFVILLYLSYGYFFFQHFMQMRQGLAIPLTLLAVTLLIESNCISFKNLFAVSFHQVALPIILMGVVSRLTFTKERKISINKFRVLCVIGLVMFVLISKVFLSSILKNLSSRVETYSKSAENAAELGLFRLPNIKTFLTYLFILFFMNEKVYQNKLFVVLFVLFALELAFRIGFSDFAILSGRFATSFSFTEIFLLPFIFNRFKQGKIMIGLFIVAQTIAAYVYQAPLIIKDYFKPSN
ncbi:EpsG family protein [Capnocytophaga cynodegmi]|uniref:EpsG family protein n=1 Tax=Capnocytophaga cynodegmi TaxID=28189 RepID=UPI0037D8B92D